MAFAVADIKRRWPFSRLIYSIPNYQFPAGTRSRSSIEDVFNYYRAVTGLQFSPQNAEDDYVEFKRVNDRSSSAVGMVGGNQTLNCIVNELGISPGAKVTHTDTSDYGPSLGTEMDSAVTPGVVMCWSGEGNKKVNLARLPDIAGTKRTYPFECNGTPAILIIPIPSFTPPFQQDIWIATVNGGHLWVYLAIKMRTGGVFPDFQQVFPPLDGSQGNVDIAAAPALCSFGARTIISWIDSDDWIFVGELAETGLLWSVRLNEKSESSPALASHNNQVFLAWVGLDDKINVAFDNLVARTFNAKFTSGIETDHPVSMAVVSSQLHVVWCDSEENEIGLGRVNTDLADNRIPFLDIWYLGTTSKNSTDKGPNIVSRGADAIVAWKGDGNENLNTTTTFFKDEGGLVHELCHAIALNHEQQRPDRDLYVDYVGPVDDDNKEYATNYKTIEDEAILGPYDHKSIMHYPSRNQLDSGSVVAATAGNITLQPSASLLGNGIIGTKILIKSGPGMGQIRQITNYTPSTRLAVVDSSWRLVPTNVSTYEVHTSKWLVDKFGQPFVEPSALLSPGDIAGLRSCYPIVDVHSLPETSEEEPVISEVHSMLYIAWRGAGNTNLNLAAFFIQDRSFPPMTLAGQNVAGQQWATLERFTKIATFSERSDVAPALYQNELVWKGDGNEDINFGHGQGSGIIYKRLIGEKTDVAPSVAVAGRFRVISWKGDGNGSINFAIVDNRGAMVAKYISPENTECTPTLASNPIPSFTSPLQHRVFCAWKGDGNEAMNVAELDIDRTNPIPVIRGLIGKTTIPSESCDEDTSPAIAFVDNSLVIAWKGDGNDYLNFMVSNDFGANFINKHTSREKSSHSPRLATARFRGKDWLFVAWKGSGNETINVGLANLNLS